LSCAVLDTESEEVVVSDFPDAFRRAGKFEMPHSGT